VPERESDGVLQDIHWSMGGIGYFPTYSLGNLYAAQFTSALRSDMPDLDGKIRSGEFALILDWLREKIHRHGAARTAEELVRDVTGQPLDAGHFVKYLRSKFSEVYGLS
jgi:carboxypeptidase Taq